MKRLFLRLVCSSLLLAQCLVYSIAQAETAYVVDQLLVGIHQEKDIDSPIIKVIATGTELQILERDGDYTKVREKAEGKMGWVDSSYIMLEKPAKLHLAELKESIRVQQGQGGSISSNDTASQGEIEALNKEIESLTQELSSEKLSTGNLEATISQHEKKLAEIEANSEDVLVKSLQEKNTSLKKYITELQQAGKPSGLTSGLSLLESAKLFTNKLILIALSLLLILGFLIGRHWEDRRIRRRHGGFRI